MNPHLAIRDRCYSGFSSLTKSTKVIRRRRLNSASTAAKLQFEPLESRTLLTATTVSPVLEFVEGFPQVEGSESQLTRDDDGLTLTANTLGLEPDAHTLWWVVFNNPEFCSGGCNGADLGNPAVEGAVLYGTGLVVGDDGIGDFTAQLTEGDISGVNEAHAHLPGADDGLLDARKAEIHFVIRSHGPVLEGDPLVEGSPAYDQTHTFNGGCATEGMEGFECFDPQAGIHLPPHTDVTVSPVLEFVEGFPQVEGSESQLTRDDDGLTLTANTLGLEPDAHTLWWVVFNNPEFCSGGCNGADLGNPAVEGAVLYGTGLVVGDDGIGDFTAQLTEGDISGVNEAHAHLPGADDGLLDARKAEIHFVIRSHGPVLEGDPLVEGSPAYDQTHTFNGGCATEGMEGFECFDPQAGIHLPPHTDVTVSPVLEFVEGFPQVEGSESQLTRDDDGLTLTANTLGLEPDAHTLWWVVFNNPEFCSGGCNGADLGNPAVEGAVLYGTGLVVGDDGIGDFTAQLTEGDISGVNEAHAHLPGADDGLLDARKAEIHFVIRSHGPVLEGDPLVEGSPAYDQTHTFNGGCATEGMEGFECFDPQAGIHLPPHTDVTVSPVLEFVEGFPQVEGSESQLTRDDDGLTLTANTLGLEPDAHTLWWVVFNNPEFCSGGCNGADLGNPAVEGAVLYGTGLVVGDDGIGDFTAQLTEGDISGVNEAHAHLPGADDGLLDARKAEIHFVIRSHGPVLEGDPLVEGSPAYDQTHTFNGGCATEGMEGFECFDPQAGIHLPPHTDVTVSPVLEFVEGFPQVEGSESQLTRDDDGLTLTANTLGLEPDAHTLWWVVFNNPEFCSGGCNGADLGNPAVEGAVLYGTGLVVGDDGIGDFTAQLTEGDISGVNEAHAHLPGADDGLLDARKAEIHFVIRSHGPVLEGDPLVEGSPAYDQTHTFNGGCATEGMEGFECFDPQAGIHLPPHTDVTVSPVLEFVEGFPQVEGSESQLTRDDDGLTLTANTLGLEPDAHTLWWVVFNNPEFCSGGCNGADLGNPAVEGAVLYGTGLVVGDDGIGDFTAQLTEGDISGVNEAHAHLPGADDGLLDARKAEIHFVIRSHGPVLEGDPLVEGSPAYDQTHTFNGGCATEGMEGFECFDPQAGIHLPSNLIVLGDVNDDGQFDELDIVEVLQAAKYRTGQPATLSEGDWNGDGVFDQFDLVAALQTGNYRVTPMAVDAAMAAGFTA